MTENDCCELEAHNSQPPRQEHLEIFFLLLSAYSAHVYCNLLNWLTIKNQSTESTDGNNVL